MQDTVAMLKARNAQLLADAAVFSFLGTDGVTKKIFILVQVPEMMIKPHARRSLMKKLMGMMMMILCMKRMILMLVRNILTRISHQDLMEENQTMSMKTWPM
ncbi:hypothetical protein BsWGS_17250 [Bradybaena similaris]